MTSKEVIKQVQLNQLITLINSFGELVDQKIGINNSTLRGAIQEVATGHDLHASTIETLYDIYSYLKGA